MSVVDLFNRDVKANKSPRNVFDISYSSLFSSPIGLILPTYVEDVKRGDKLDLSVSCETRTRPVNTAAFAAFDEITDFWFVPYRLIWSGYDEWRLNQAYPHTSASLYPASKQELLPCTSWTSAYNYIDSVSPTSPTQDSVGYHFAPYAAYCLRLLDLLGYGAVPHSSFSQISVTNDLSDFEDLSQLLAQYTSALDAGGNYFNYFRLAAFNAIYQHAYRSLEFEPYEPWRFNTDSLFNARAQGVASVDNSNAPLADHSTPTLLQAATESRELDFKSLFTPHYKNWREDLFVSMKPFNGFDASLSVWSPSNGANGASGSSFSWPINTVPGDNASLPYVYGSADSFQGADGAIDGQDLDVVMPEQRLAVTSTNGVANYAHLFAPHIYTLLAQDKFTRSMILGKKNLNSQLRAIFGDGKDYDNHSPVYLGTFKNDVNISEIVATSAGSDNSSSPSTSVLGELAGKGYGSQNGKVFERQFDEDGIVIGCHYIMPRNNYDGYRVNKFNVKSSRYDYFYPQFDGLGLQPTFAFERNLFISPDSKLVDFDPNSLMGYSPRYYEYKTRQNETHGSFMSDQPDYDWTISNNTFNVLFASDPLNYKISPTLSDRIFTLAYDGSIQCDPFMCYYYYNVKRVSDMEQLGVPSL